LAGYKEGRRGDPVESEGAAAEEKVADNDNVDAKEGKRAETFTNTPQTPPAGSPLPPEKELGHNEPTKR
jgi:hypothetical protein